jgi:transcriptional regulator with XRE-family HTH domain
LRRNHGWTQEELAFRVGVDRTYQSDLERGMRNFGVLLIFHYAKALKVRPEDLFADRAVIGSKSGGRSGGSPG